MNKFGCIVARLAVVLVFLLLATAPGRAGEAELARGEYLATIMDCGGCHTGGALMGKPDPARYLAGSEVGFHLPGLGIFNPSNLTPDEETGLGSWNAEEIIAAIREGERHDGRILAPIMPWMHYAALTDADARALTAYLQSLPAVRFETPRPLGPDEAPDRPYLTVVIPE